MKRTMFKVNVDTSALTALTGLKDALDQEAKLAAKNLAAMGYAKMHELAAQRLHSRREMFVQGLDLKQVDDNTWVIVVDAKVRFIDDGLKPYNMLDSLLKSPKAKSGKKGKYLAVPFHHGPGKGPATATPAQLDLISTVRAAMKKQGIPFKKIETGPNGQPLLGRLHSFDINEKPIKKFEGPGQGKGPIGQVKQGSSGIPLLRGVNVIQRMVGGKARKEILTFRMASESQRGTGKWDHPGLAPQMLTDTTADWMLKTWNDEIVPALIANIDKLF